MQFVAANNDKFQIGTDAPVIVPATATVGDLALVIYFFSGSGQTHVLPDWTKIMTREDATKFITVVIWRKVLVAGDPGSTVTVSSSNPSNVKRHLHCIVYSAANFAAFNNDFETTATASHTTPSIAVDLNQSIILNYVVDRSSPASDDFTFPSNVVSRSLVTQNGGGSMSSILVDDEVAAGTRGSNIITGTVVTDNAAMGSILLESSATAHSKFFNDTISLQDFVIPEGGSNWIWHTDIWIGG